MFNFQKSSNSTSAEEEANVLEIRVKGLSEKGEIQLKVEIAETDYKAGAIYKVNSCYYDSNGDFLYRAPSNT